MWWEIKFLPPTTFKKWELRFQLPPVFPSAAFFQFHLKALAWNVGSPPSHSSAGFRWKWARCADGDDPSNKAQTDGTLQTLEWLGAPAVSVYWESEEVVDVLDDSGDEIQPNDIIAADLVFYRDSWQPIGPIAMWPYMTAQEP
jgi:hypothetical protein